VGTKSSYVTRNSMNLTNYHAKCPKGNSPLTADSIMRLDRLQTIIPNYPAYIPEPFSLSTEVLGVLMAMLRSLFGAKEEPEFETLKELVFESLPDEAKLNQT